LCVGHDVQRSARVSECVTRWRVVDEGVHGRGESGGRQQQLSVLRVNRHGLRRRESVLRERWVPPADDGGECEDDGHGDADADVLRSRRGGWKQRRVLVDGR
jgi:hypothetical protein